MVVVALVQVDRAVPAGKIAMPVPVVPPAEPPVPHLHPPEHLEQAVGLTDPAAVVAVVAHPLAELAEQPPVEAHVAVLQAIVVQAAEVAATVLSSIPRASSSPGLALHRATRAIPTCAQVVPRVAPVPQPATPTDKKAETAESSSIIDVPELFTTCTYNSSPKPTLFYVSLKTLQNHEHTDHSNSYHLRVTLPYASLELIKIASFISPFYTSPRVQLPTTILPFSKENFFPPKEHLSPTKYGLLKRFFAQAKGNVSQPEDIFALFEHIPSIALSFQPQTLPGGRLTKIAMRDGSSSLHEVRKRFPAKD